ncbi:hypothetical protein C8R48DRAFT_766590 [Suillus tomentosus]|nr:hypothetical protein C8R48DRAFT_766590 [Suillus tomentosus]
MRSLLSPLHHLLNLTKSATKAALERRLVELTEQADDRMKDQSWKDDPWLSQLDWTPIAGVLWPLNRGVSMSMYRASVDFFLSQLESTAACSSTVPDSFLRRKKPTPTEPKLKAFRLKRYQDFAKFKEDGTESHCHHPPSFVLARLAAFLLPGTRLDLL